ncbi:MAG: DUF4115 domain-containing protein [Bacillota bacterium]|nr:DUF4115 domain-containing protein [Bacillota bacterium]
MRGVDGHEQITAALRDLGRELQARRVETGRTLADAEAALKIHHRYLAALEAGDAGTFPGLVYQLGFLRAYGDFLGLPGEQLVVRCRAAMQPAPPQALGDGDVRPGPVKTPEAARPVLKPSPAPIKVQPAVALGQELRADPVAPPTGRVVQRRRRPAAGGRSASRGALRLVVVLLLVAAVVALGYTVARAPGPQDGQAGTDPPAGDTPPVTPPGDDPQVPPPFGKDSIKVLSETPQEIRFEVAADSLQVTVRLADRVWIRVLADGEELVADIRQPGVELVFAAANQLLLRTGRASKTSCSVFGVDLGPAGPQDDARTVVFVRQR